MNSPLFDLNALDSILNEGSIPVEAVKVIHVYICIFCCQCFKGYAVLQAIMFLLQRGWYHNVVYLGKKDDIPILTMTYA